MAVIDTGYELDDICTNLQAEIKAWNVATVVNGGAASAFGSTGQRIFSMPAESDKVGRSQPIIYVESRGMEGSIYTAKDKPEGSGGQFLYDAGLEAMVVIAARGTWVYKHTQLRKWASSLRKWLEEHGPNGYCQAFACGKTAPLALPGRGGVMTWQIPVTGVREVVRNVLL